MNANVYAFFFVVFLALITLVSAKAPTWKQLDGYTFEQYKVDFRRTYKDQIEYEMRRDIFQDNLKTFIAHNKDAQSSWKMGVNQFTDRTIQEKRAVNGYRKDIGYVRRGDGVPKGPVGVTKASAALPTHVDWREKGVVTSVKDQGQCGSCWTFASAENIESHYALANHGLLPTISEQQILSCTPNPDECGGSGGCGGGTAELAYSTLIQNGGGITSEWIYPYLSYRGNDYSCMFNASSTDIAANVTGYIKLPENEYDPLLNAVATTGPVSISVDATNWHAYETGVFTGCNQTVLDINHNVQLVGYGNDGKQDYWLVRNSWAPTWGESGYIRLYRSSHTSCVLDNTPQDGSGCNGGPAQVTVCGECGILYDTCYPIIQKN